MIKLIVFDLDGVLMDSKEIHYNSLNQSLKDLGDCFVIGRQQHLAKYDGLSTTMKLHKLHKQKGLPIQKFDLVWKNKQISTIKYLKKFIKSNLEMIEMFKQLKQSGYYIVIASNAIRSTVNLSIQLLGIADFVDRVYTNQDVIKPKPSSLIYLKIMTDFCMQPYQLLILQDSHIGRTSAICSGANVMAIEKLTDVNITNIKQYIKLKNLGENMPIVKWNAKETNVLIPMAGRGSRFQKQGYTFPKPLIQVNGKPMIQVVVENLNIQANFIYIVQKQHYDKYNLYYLLNLLTPNCKILQVQNLTQGAACTTLLAKQFINNDSHLVIANSDQYVQWQSNQFFYSMTSPQIDGGILTFNSTHPKWSFVRLNDIGYAIQVAEKKPISNLATVGIYYWNKGCDYVKYAQQMIEKNIRVNNQFYVCPVFNQAIKDNKKFKAFDVKHMWGLGTPEDLIYFQNNFSGVI